MFKFTETITIHATRSKIWQTLEDINAWWPPSNPEHIGIEVRSFGKPLGLGTEIDFKECVAGVKAHAKGKITNWSPGSEAAWEGVAIYRYCGIPIRVSEGVSWRIEGNNDMSDVSATVWAEFPKSAFGRFLEWYARTVLNVVDRDREHARCELQYLKRTIEGA